VDSNARKGALRIVALNKQVPVLQAVRWDIRAVEDAVLHASVAKALRTVEAARRSHHRRREHGAGEDSSTEGNEDDLHS
jgi:hypothetical protein